uniref:Uncharacterized protein n=1 Tax=Cryptomonas curvata TaxID=233186 RepID=A0A7S0LZE8_9CRYP|mmetsp:Transcript_16364/g.34666  ORF Transcript_16364/g.34666 Transcript_16364/m.34666 type:complete len:180 (+) Transcript_16364:43-582(+)
MTQQVIESLPQWQPGVALSPSLFLANTSNLFEQLKQQVVLAIQGTKLREAAELAESRRIAELFPIEWHNKAKFSESPHLSNEQHLTSTEGPFRTPSPVENQSSTQCFSPGCARAPISEVCKSEAAPIARRYSPARKSIFKTPALSFSVKSIESPRNHELRLGYFRNLEPPHIIEVRPAA